MTGPDIAFDVAPDGWRPDDGDAEALCRAAVRAVDRALPGLDLAGWELGIALTDDPGIRALNRDHRGVDRPTDVLSFPLDRPEPDRPAPGGIPGGIPGSLPVGLLGDIVLSGETLRRDAGRLGRAPADHLTHLVVHGMLHLLGYDHETLPDAARMEGLEIAILAGLGVANPYAGPQMAESSLQPLETENA
ncbi:MAG: rRNA maturation RNase YbeY [Rhodospirillaceae bacterium]|nr:rRNA maturation RNase YbeY [Rhodospirillaceae bacterium]MCY4065576.1 rRNA maturation RNase YbeY [Rhodospirillaceae bacterium]